MEHRLPHSTMAPGEARRLSWEFLRNRMDEARAVEFLIMVSEVVGNAVRHGRPEPDGRIGLRLESEAAVARAVVTDAAPVFSFDREILAERDLDHFGLFVVDALADRWGLSLDGKKAVWFEVDVDPSAQSG